MGFPGLGDQGPGGARPHTMTTGADGPVCLAAEREAPGPPLRRHSASRLGLDDRLHRSGGVRAGCSCRSLGQEVGGATRHARLTRRQHIESAAKANVAGMGKQPRAWTVDFDSDAVIDFEDVKSRGDRKAVFNAVQKLKDLGPDVPSPHMKSLKGQQICSSCGQSRGLARLGRSMRGSAVGSWFWRWPRRRKTSIVRSWQRAIASRATVDSDNRSIIMGWR
jgi:hypothetical protein